MNLEVIVMQNTIIEGQMKHLRSYRANTTHILNHHYILATEFVQICSFNFPKRRQNRQLTDSINWNNIVQMIRGTSRIFS